MDSFFEEAVNEYSTQFLCKICKDYDLPLEEILQKYQNLPLKLLKPKILMDPCPIKTLKGSDCKHNCIPGQSACKMHGRPQVVKVVKVKKIKKIKIIPEHNHKPFELPTEYCELCDTHGDLMNAMLLNFKFMRVH